MHHSIEWQDDTVNAALEERATVGDLRLFLNGQNATTHILDNKVGDHVTVSLYGLVNGLIHEWWSILGARDQEFSLCRYRTGYLLPDIRIQFDGAAFEISAEQCAYSDPDLRFWGGMRELLPRSEGEAGLTSLINDVLGRLEKQNVLGTSAALRWRRIQFSLASNERAFCEAAGALGLDPYQITEHAAKFIEKSENVFGSEALVEFVAGSRDVDRSKLIAWVEKMNRGKGFRYRLANLRPIVDSVEKAVPMRRGEAAWAAGYRRARAVRQKLNLLQNHRFSSFMDLARLFGAARNYNLAPKVDGISALRRERPDGIHAHIRNFGDYPGAPTTHMFTLARVIGDAACFSAPETAPINRLSHAYRQAAGRAFAAEFLAPIDEIRSMKEDERDGYSIASEFRVSLNVIDRQLENQERITEACANET